MRLSGHGRLAKQSLLLSVFTVLGQIVVLGAFVLLGRQDGVVAVGHVTVSLGTATVLAGLIDLGANNLWVREIASGRMSADTYRERALAKILIGLLVGSVILVSCSTVPSLRPFLGTGMFTIAWVVAQTLQTGLRADGRNGHMAAAGVVDRLSFGLLFVTTTSITIIPPADRFAIAYVVGALVGGALCQLWTRPSLRLKSTKPAVRHVWRGGRYFGGYSVIISMQSLDVAIGSILAGPATAGVYGAVSRWTQPVMLPAASLSTVVKPVFARFGLSRQAWREVRGSLWLAGLSVVASLLVAALAEPLVSIIMGPNFLGSAPVLSQLAVAAALSSVAQPLTVALQFSGADRATFVIYAASIGLQLVGVAALVGSFGATGISLSRLAGQCLLLAGLVACVYLAARSGNFASPDVA